MNTEESFEAIKQKIIKTHELLELITQYKENFNNEKQRSTKLENEVHKLKLNVTMLSDEKDRALEKCKTYLDEIHLLKTGKDECEERYNILQTRYNELMINNQIEYQKLQKDYDKYKISQMKLAQECKKAAKAEYETEKLSFEEQINSLTSDRNFFENKCKKLSAQFDIVSEENQKNIEKLKLHNKVLISSCTQTDKSINHSPIKEKLQLKILHNLTNENTLLKQKIKELETELEENQLGNAPVSDILSEMISFPSALSPISDSWAFTDIPNIIITPPTPKEKLANDFDKFFNVPSKIEKQTKDPIIVTESETNQTLFHSEEGTMEISRVPELIPEKMLENDVMSENDTSDKSLNLSNNLMETTEELQKAIESEVTQEMDCSFPNVNVKALEIRKVPEPIPEKLLESEVIQEKDASGNILNPRNNFIKTREVPQKVIESEVTQEIGSSALNADIVAFEIREAPKLIPEKLSESEVIQEKNPSTQTLNPSNNLIETRELAQKVIEYEVTQEKDCSAPNGNIKSIEIKKVPVLIPEKLFESEVIQDKDATAKTLNPNNTLIETREVPQKVIGSDVTQEKDCSALNGNIKALEIQEVPELILEKPLESGVIQEKDASAKSLNPSNTLMETREVAQKVMESEVTQEKDLTTPNENIVLLEIPEVPDFIPEKQLERELIQEKDSLSKTLNLTYNLLGTQEVPQKLIEYDVTQEEDFSALNENIILLEIPEVQELIPDKLSKSEFIQEKDSMAKTMNLSNNSFEFPVPQKIIESEVTRAKQLPAQNAGVPNPIPEKEINAYIPQTDYFDTKMKKYERYIKLKRKHSMAFNSSNCNKIPSKKTKTISVLEALHVLNKLKLNCPLPNFTNHCCSCKCKSHSYPVKRPYKKGTVSKELFCLDRACSSGSHVLLKRKTKEVLGFFDVKFEGLKNERPKSKLDLYIDELEKKVLDIERSVIPIEVVQFKDNEMLEEIETFKVPELITPLRDQSETNILRRSSRRLSSKVSPVELNEKPKRNRISLFNKIVNKVDNNKNKVTDSAALKESIDKAVKQHREKMKLLRENFVKDFSSAIEESDQSRVTFKESKEIKSNPSSPNKLTHLSKKSSPIGKGTDESISFGFLTNGAEFIESIEKNIFEKDLEVGSNYNSKQLTHLNDEKNSPNINCEDRIGIKQSLNIKNHKGQRVKRNLSLLECSEDNSGKSLERELEVSVMLKDKAKDMKGLEVEKGKMRRKVGLKSKRISEDEIVSECEGSEKLGSFECNKVLRIEEPVNSSQNVSSTLKHCENVQLDNANKSLGEIDYCFSESEEEEPKVRKLGIEQAWELIRKLDNYANVTEAVNEIVEEFVNEDPKMIASLLLRKLLSNSSDETDPREGREIPLTAVQKWIIGFILRLERGDCKVKDHFLQMVEETLFCKKLELNELISLGRMRLAFYKISGDLLNCRVFCMEAFYFLGDAAVPLFFVMLTSWTDILPPAEDNNIIAKVIVQTIHMKLCGQPGFNLFPLKLFLRDCFQYPMERWDSKKLFNEVIAEYLIKPGRMMDLALILLCKMGPCKEINQIIKNQFLTLIEKDMPVNLKATFFILLGNICCGLEEVSGDILEWLKRYTEDSNELIRRSVEVVMKRLRAHKKLV